CSRGNPSSSSPARPAPPPNDATRGGSGTSPLGRLISLRNPELLRAVGSSGGSSRAGHSFSGRSSSGAASPPCPACRFGPVWFVVLVEEESMPKIIVNAFLTLDGVMQAPGAPDEDPEGGFVHGGWQAPYDDDVMGRRGTEAFPDDDGFLLGRKTYDIFANYWPKITDPNHPIATALNSRPKYVVSRSLERVTWNNSSLIKGEVVAELRKLRQQPGRTLH